MSDEYPRGFEPQENRTSLISASKRYVEFQIGRLEPDADITPTLMYRDREGENVLMSLLVPNSTEDERMALEEFITASLTVDGATEAVFISPVWMVASENFQQHRAMPSAHPDRVEGVALMHYSPDGHRTHQVPVCRNPGKAPTLEAWQAMPAVEAGGAIGEAIRIGLATASRLPPEMLDMIAVAKAAGETEKLIKSFVRGKASARNSWRKHNEEHPQFALGCEMCKVRQNQR